MSVQVIHGNALTLPFADNSVDLVVTSPPYFGLRTYRDGGEHYDGQVGSEATPAQFLDALIAATREMIRVVKPTGSIFVNLGDKYSQRVAARASSHQDGLFRERPDLRKDWKRDRALGLARMPRENIINPETGQFVPEKSLMGLPWRYAIRCMDELGLILRAEIVWSKPNGVPEPTTDRVRRSHEQWFHFAQTKHPYSVVGELERESATRSVWTIPVAARVSPPDSLGVSHGAAFPIEWPRRIISAWSPTGGVVLDPFGGTGTTALVADVLGREGITVDLSADYCRMARWRTGDPKERGRVEKLVGLAGAVSDGDLGGAA